MELKVLEYFPASILKTLFLGQTINSSDFSTISVENCKFSSADQGRAHTYTCIPFTPLQNLSQKMEISIKGMTVIYIIIPEKK